MLYRTKKLRKILQNFKAIQIFGYASKNDRLAMDIEKDEQDQLAKKKKEFLSNTKPRNLNIKTEKRECSK